MLFPVALMTMIVSQHNSNFSYIFLQGFIFIDIFCDSSLYEGLTLANFFGNNQTKDFYSFLTAQRDDIFFYTSRFVHVILVRDPYYSS